MSSKAGQDNDGTKSVKTCPDETSCPMGVYFKKRVNEQRQWYENKANLNKKIFMSYQTWIIVLGASIPVLVAFEGVFAGMKVWGGLVAAVISAIISILAGLDKLKQPQPNWFNYRANEEAIKKEEWFYTYKAGPYKEMTEKEAQVLFVERIESIISADIARVTHISDETPARADENGGNGETTANGVNNDHPVTPTTPDEPKRTHPGEASGNPEEAK